MTDHQQSLSRFGDKPTVQALANLLQSTPEELSNVDLVTLNLLCAANLPGSEGLCISDYHERTRQWAGFVRNWTPAFEEHFRKNPAEFNHSDSYFRMMVLVQILKKHIGVHFKPELIRLPSDPTPCSTAIDSRDLLIHGPLGPTLSGTCNNIPMVVVAVARELNYPVHLALNPYHVYAKWIEPNGHTFNIEASCPGGMNSHPDEHYRVWPHPLPPTAIASGYYLRALNASDELALCLASRAWVLEAHGRDAEATWAYAHACRLAPAEPMYPRMGARCVGRLLRGSYNALTPSNLHIHDLSLLQSGLLNPATLLPDEHVPAAMCVLACWHHAVGRKVVAAELLADAKSWERRHPHIGGVWQVSCCFPDSTFLHRAHSWNDSASAPGDLDLYLMGLSKGAAGW